MGVQEHEMIRGCRNMNTAFVRLGANVIRIKEDSGRSKKEFAKELREAGFEVLKIFNFEASESDFKDWMLKRGLRW